MKSDPVNPGARLCPQDQPQQPRNCNGLFSFESSRIGHVLRLVLRTQPRSVTGVPQ